MPLGISNESRPENPLQTTVTLYPYSTRYLANLVGLKAPMLLFGAK